MRRRILCLPLSVAAAFVVLAPSDGRGAGALDPSADAADLGAYRWKNRVVLLFAPSPDDPKYRVQREAFSAAAADLAERDVVVLNDAAPGDDGRLRRAYGIDGFEVLLIGKDGGVKLRARDPVDVGFLLGLIDAMPMRREEMCKNAS